MHMAPYSTALKTIHDIQPASTGTTYMYKCVANHMTHLYTWLLPGQCLEAAPGTGTPLASLLMVIWPVLPASEVSLEDAGWGFSADS